MQCAVKIFCPITICFYRILLDLVLTMNQSLNRDKESWELADYLTQIIKFCVQIGELTKNITVYVPLSHIFKDILVYYSNMSKT